MVETLHKKFYGTDRQYPIIPQEQWQETNAYVLKLPGTEKKEYPNQAVSSTAARTVNTFELRQIMFYGTATVNELNCHIGQPPGFWEH